ncbi:MAG: hypothetical protein E3J64_01600 [Anaerolineales bacterium]|nr:MAG: hypothetical protein E3J64_01600 [Anaerolineales bacterium]
MTTEKGASTERHADGGDRLTTAVAILIAIVSMVSAGVVWRAAIAESNATTSERGGLIDSVKREAALATDVSTLLWEARYAAAHTLYAARLTVLEGEDDVGARREAEGLALIAESLAEFTPLATDEEYRTAAGGLDLDARLSDLRDLNPDLRDLDPDEQFGEADRYHLESRLLLAVVVVFAVSLFFLTLAEIVVTRHIRYVLAALGSLMFLAGLVGIVAAEVYCAIAFTAAT